MVACIPTKASPFPVLYSMQYQDQIKSPKWQKKRLEILKRDEFTCQECGNKEQTLHIHHKHYNKGAKIWEYEGWELTTLCETCHSKTHDKIENKPIDKTKESITNWLSDLNDKELQDLLSILEGYVQFIKNSFDYNVLSLIDDLILRSHLFDGLKDIIDKEIQVESFQSKINELERRISFMVVDDEKYNKYLDSIKELPF